MGNRGQRGAAQVFRRRVVDPWDDLWAKDLRHHLREAAHVLADALGLSRERFGILPAVYFPRLRMGSVVFHDWRRNAKDVKLALPWKRRYTPPPFTCFAPSITATEESQVGLITQVASIVDSLGAPDRHRALPALQETDFGVHVGTVHWNAREQPADGVVDADELVAAGVVQVSSVFCLPSLTTPMLYVPLLYVQAADEYSARRFSALMRAAAAQTWQPTVDHSERDAAVRVGRDRLPRQRLQVIRRALAYVAEAARLRATHWLNPKTHLLNQAGFDGLKDDLQRRVAAGQLYAEMFFDIDDFKTKNDRFGYVGADLIASQLIDRILLAIQRDVSDEYAAYRAKRVVPYGKPNGFRALVAHVSGDEFKLFVRSNMTREHAAHKQDEARAREVAMLTQFAARIIDAAVGVKTKAPVSVTDRERWTRHARAFKRLSPTRYFLNGTVVQADRASVSVGIAVCSVPERRDGSRVWPIAANDWRIKRYPIDEDRISAARTALNELDGLAERALTGAKKVPSKCMQVDRLALDGGRLQHGSADTLMLLLGRMDGVQAGDTFDVFTDRAREGRSIASVRILPLSETDRRTAPVARIRGRLKARREDYYVRMRPRTDGSVPMALGGTLPEYTKRRPQRRPSLDNRITR